MIVLIELDSNDLKIGAVNDALDLARYSRDLDVVYYLAGSLNDEFSKVAEDCGIKLVHYRSRQMSRFHFFSYIFSVIRWLFLIKKICPDIIHLNYVSWGPSLGFAAYLCGIPVVARAGGTYNPRNLTHRWVSRYIANCAQQGSDLANSILADKIVVAGDLINFERFKNLEFFSGPYPAKSNDTVRFLFLGQLVERKGIDILVNAFSSVSKNCELFLVGGDWSSLGFPQKIKKMIKYLNLTDRVHCLNHREDAIALIGDCDVFVLPSLSEARPRSIIEAMLIGKCVLSTDVGGIPSLVQNGQTGLLVKSKDIHSLGEAIEKLVKDSELRKSLAINARQYALQTFDPVKTVKNYIDIYIDVLKQKKTGCFD